MTDQLNLNLPNIKSRNRNINLKKNYTETKKSNNMKELNKLMPSLNFSSRLFTEAKNYENNQLQTLPYLGFDKDDDNKEKYDDINSSFLAKNLPISNFI